jgi:hypothetical protein
MGFTNPNLVTKFTLHSRPLNMPKRRIPVRTKNLNRSIVKIIKSFLLEFSAST